jgi:catechol 2,3-dioxygenase-like lactoylglutathione lyase family enzyme
LILKEETQMPEPQLRAHLHYIELGSPDPEALAGFYGDAFDMRIQPSADGWIGRGPERILAFGQGPAGSLLSAGYAVDDPEGLELLGRRLSAAGAPFERAGTQIFADDAVAFCDPDGNRIVFGIPRDDEIKVGPGLAARLQHLVLSSADASRLVDFYTRIVGLRESDRVHDEEGGLRTSFMRSDREHHSLAVFQAAKNRLDHHCYEAGDWNLIRDWGDRFAERHVPVKWGPGRHGPGNNLFLFINDPDDNWVEISAELEIVSETRPVGRWPHEERTLNKWGQGFLRS